jgi:hypothetical protein
LADYFVEGWEFLLYEWGEWDGVAFAVEAVK